MPDKPPAEVAIDEAVVRALVNSQGGRIGDATRLPIAHAADGWDCSVWRLGAAVAVRLPRRAAAAPLVLHEQTFLPEVAERLAGSGVGVPAPLVNGVAAHGYPWPWSIVPWFDGEPGYRIRRADRSGWARPLARALRRLHVPAPKMYPMNVYRGVPLASRSDSVLARLRALAGRVDADALSSACAVWDAAVRAQPWTERPVWIHGDLHPATSSRTARGSSR